MRSTNKPTIPAARPQPAKSARALATLRSAAAVRKRCRLVYDWVAAGQSSHFTLDENRLDDVAACVADVTRTAYPDLKIPPHSRWRHFSAGGVDRWAQIERRLAGATPHQRACAAIDLATISVLLDAGAGDRWRYREDATGLHFGRSEGLAVASFDMFVAGAFSSDANHPLRVDTATLKEIDAARLAKGFQASETNRLVGLDQRVAILNRLGHALEGKPEFGSPPRPGHLADYLARRCPDGRVPAPLILNVLLELLASIWPSGLIVEGVNFGDAGFHPAVHTRDITDRIVPFHKLSQWLVYSLIEPLTMYGLTTVDLDGLTALPEYRNGGLLTDLGVIRPRRPILEPQEVRSELVVEWRALTVTLIDDLLPLVRTRLDLDQAFSLPHLLQGGTWSAGRALAFERRPPVGEPPFPLVTDGSVF